MDYLPAQLTGQNPKDEIGLLALSPLGTAFEWTQVRLNGLCLSEAVRNGNRSLYDHNQLPQDDR